MMKKISLTFAAVAAFFCVFAASAFAMGTDVTNVISNVNLRIGPGTNYEVMTVIPSGSAVFVNTADDGNGWAYITYNDTNGWVANRYLQNQANLQPAYQPTPVVSNTPYTISSAHYIRSGPSTAYAAYTTVPTGATVYVDSVANGWAHCYYGNYEGYIATSGIAGLGGAAATTGSTTPTTYGSTSYGGYNYANVYDYNYYRSHNTDLAAAFGNNTDAYLQHFVTHGMAEGRQGISSFNVYTYRDQHPELVAMFGNNLPAYYKWACGIPV